MSTKKDRLNEVYEHLQKYHGVHSKKDFAIALQIKQPGLYSAMGGNESYLTKSLFQKISGAFPGVFNLKYLLNGEGYLLTVEEEAKIEELEHPTTSQSIYQPTAFENSALMEKVISVATEAKDRLIARLEKDVSDKDDIIANLHQQIEDLRKDKESLHAAIDMLRQKVGNSDFPFGMGVADKGDKDSARV